MTKALSIQRGAVSTRLMMGVIASAIGLAATPGLAKERNFKNHPGYVDGSAFAKLAEDAETLIEVSINGVLLRTIANSLGQENEELGDLLSGIVSISAVVMEDGSRQDDAIDLAAEIAEDLENDGWERIARVRDGDDNVTIMVLVSEDDDTIAGITVMVSEKGGHVVFANIAGSIDLGAIAKLSGGLNIPGLEHLAGADFHKAVKVRKGSKKKRHHRE